MKKQAGYLLLRIAVILLAGVASAQTTSALWGETGELWSAQSRLPDLSFAGYHYGEDPIPLVHVVADVSDFGAVGDGKTDSTKAFQDAIEQSCDGAIYILDGRFVIAKQRSVRKPFQQP